MITNLYKSKSTSIAKIILKKHPYINTIYPYCRFLRNYDRRYMIMNNNEYEKCLKMVNENLNGNVAIFVDYDNIYHGLRSFALDANSDEYDIFNLLWRLYNRDVVRVFRAYADYDQIKVSLRNIQQKRVQIRHVYGNGLGEMFRKNASDIELSIDAIETCYKDISVNTFVFVTTDSDMIPIMSRMIYKGKKVHLLYIGVNSSQYQDITQYAHVSYDLVNIFDINTERAKPEFWKDSVLEHISNWYSDPKNKGKIYGAKWLNEDMQQKFQMSQKLASSVIQYLEENRFITKELNTEKGIEGYIINS